MSETQGRCGLGQLKVIPQITSVKIKDDIKILKFKNVKNILHRNS